MVEEDALAALDARAGQQLQPDGQQRASREGAGGRQDESAAQLGKLRPGEVRADSLPRARLRLFAPMDLEAAHADRLARRKKLELLVLRDRPRDRDRPRAHARGRGARGGARVRARR